MTFQTLRSVCMTALVGMSLMALASPVSAESIIRPPPMKSSKGDTLAMTCEHARSLVHGSGGTILTSGPNRFDLYHIGGGTCVRLHQRMQEAFVPTRDVASCFVGYTCEPLLENRPDD